MLVCSGGVIVGIGSFNEETIDKAVMCIIVTPLPRKSGVGWYIR